jgi:tRNA-Thr(GGU) m(6)t(6)A37 methyltransferase TsaA
MRKSSNAPGLQPIGIVRSSLKKLEDCPLQGSEGAPEAWVEIHADFADGLDGITIGKEVILLTWFHEADRNVIKCYPRNNTTAPHVGVFTTRSPDRPNPIGLHQVTITGIEKAKIRVFPLEALDGTPVIDIKPVL